MRSAIIAFLGIGLAACFSVPRLSAPEDLAAIAVLDLDGNTLVAATPLRAWAASEPLPLRADGAARTIVVGFRPEQVPSMPWPDQPLELAGCGPPNLPVPAFSAHFEGESLVADDDASTAALPRLRMPGACARPAADLLSTLAIDARCLSPAGCVRAIATREDCEIDLDFRACLGMSGGNPGVVRASVGVDGAIEINWACSNWSCERSATDRRPATSYDCVEDACAIDLYADRGTLPIEHDEVEVFPVSRLAAPYPSFEDRFEVSPYYLHEGYLQGAVVKGDHLLVAAANPPLYICEGEGEERSFLYRVGLEDLGVEPLGALPSCTNSVCVDPDGDGFYALFEAVPGWHLGRFDGMGTLTASVGLRQTMDLGRGPEEVVLYASRLDGRDEVGSVATRMFGGRREILVLSTSRAMRNRVRAHAILRFDADLTKIGQIELDRGLRPYLFVVDGDRLIIPYSEDHRIQILDGGMEELIQILGDVGKYTADVLPLPDGGLLASSNQHFFAISPEAAGQRSISRHLVEDARFLTQRPWLRNDDAGRPVVLVAGSSRPQTEFRATLRFFEPAFDRFSPAKLDVGHGVAGRLIEDGRGRIWMLRPWDAHVLRLR